MVEITTNLYYRLVGIGTVLNLTQQDLSMHCSAKIVKPPVTLWNKHNALSQSDLIDPLFTSLGNSKVGLKNDEIVALTENFKTNKKEIFTS